MVTEQNTPNFIKGALMKYRTGITLACLSVLSLYPAKRESNRKYMEKISQQRRDKGIVDATAAAIHATENEINVTGSIVMPIDGVLEGSGTGFSYAADAQNGTVMITFDELTIPTVTATAHDVDASRNVKIIALSEATVILHIEGFTPGNPTVVEFNATQIEQA